MWLILAILLGALHVGYVVFHEGAQRGGDPIYSTLAESLLWFAFLVLFVAAWKFYCNEWNRLSGQSILRILTEKIWVPFVAVFLITEPRYYIPERMEFSVVATGIALFIALVDWDRSIRKAVEVVFAGHHMMDRRVLYSYYPPRKRSDLLPMDLLFNVATFVMIIKKVT